MMMMRTLRTEGAGRDAAVYPSYSYDTKCYSTDIYRDILLR